MGKIAEIVKSALVISLTYPISGYSQSGGIDMPERPGSKRQEFPPIPLEKEVSPTPLLLPKIPQMPSDDRLSSNPQVIVKKIRITGHTVFPDSMLADIAKPYEGRTITFEELQMLRNALTLHYVNEGYINSGAVIPDQKVTDGILQIHIIEGRLTNVEISGTDRLRNDYIKERLQIGSEDYLNLQQLQERIQLLHQDRRIERIHAELRPGLKRGEGELRVLVEESQAYEFGISFNNHRSSSVGELHGEIYGTALNLTGFGDELNARFSVTDGLKSGFVSYSFPFTAHDSRVRFYYDRSHSNVVEKPVKRGGIRSDVETYGIALSHPFYHTTNTQVTDSLVLEKRQSKTFLFGQLYDFVSQTPGRGGRKEITALRFIQEWVDRTPNQVLALRSTLSWGVDAFGASSTKESPGEVDFFAWTGQFQWVRRLWDTDNQILLRSDVQLTPDVLIPLEKFALGGANSVRGYPENQWVRDNGWFTSVELRFPVFKLPIPGISKTMGDGMVQFATFYDFGWSENVKERSPRPNTLSSTGIGLRWDPHRNIHSEIYWGFPLRNMSEGGGEHSLQDSGIHFSFNINLL